LQRIDQYDITMEHRPGRKHWNADAVSRRPCPQCKRDDGMCEEESQIKEAYRAYVNLNLGVAVDAFMTTAPEAVRAAYAIICTLAAQEAQPPMSGITCAVATRAQQKETEDQEEGADVQQEPRMAQQQAAGPVPGDHPARPMVEDTDGERQHAAPDNMVLMDGWAQDELHASQLGDNDIAPVMQALIDGSGRPSKEQMGPYSAKAHELWGQWDRLRLDGGVLQRAYENDSGTKTTWQLVVPAQLQDSVIYHHHDVRHGGHFDAKKTLAKIRLAYYWARMSSQVARYCKVCDGCTGRKTGKRKFRAPLQSYKAGAPWVRVSVDLMGPLTKTKKGNKYIMVVTDQFSKWTEAYAIKNKEAVTVAKHFTDNWCNTNGPPRILHSDQGNEFTADVFVRMCKLLGIDKTRTSAYHPEGNGQVERYNRTMGALLAIYCDEHYRDWDTHLPYLAAAYRSTVHSSTGFTPNLMIRGREVSMPITVLHSDPNRDPELLDPDDYVNQLQDMLERTHTAARHILGKAATHQKRHYDHRALERPQLVAGQAVWLLELKGLAGVSKKLQSPWKPGAVIIKRLDDVNYRIKTGPSATPKVVHVNRLMPYEGRNPPTWYRPGRT
jgi:hypothetical protein